MKTTLLAIIILFSITSCKKITEQEQATVKAEGTPVTFAVSGFSQSNSPFSTSGTGTNKVTNGTATQAGVTKIHYVVFNQAGNEVSRLEQNVAFPNSLFRVDYRTKYKLNDNTPFGSLKDTLKQGTYTFYVAGTTEETANLNREQNWGGQDFYYPAILSESRIYPSTAQNRGDLFLYKGELVVGPASMNQTVTLNRMMGKLEMVIEDALPKGLYSFEIEFKTENEYLITSTLKPGGSLYDGVYRFHSGNYPSESNDGKYTRSWTFLNTATPMSMTIKMFNASKLVATKTIENIKLTANQKTTVTGKLLEAGPTNGAFNLTFNQNWGSTGNVIKF